MAMTVEGVDNVFSESDNEKDRVSIKIDKKLAHLHHDFSKHSIFRVYDDLRKENEDAYEPQIISIGPYHRGKAKLKPMEQHKLQYLQQLRERKHEHSVDRYVIAMRRLEGRARECYADPIGVNSDEFVEMMLLDSCFIIELFRKDCNDDLIRIDDPVFKFKNIGGAIRRDLMILENQLPFCILLEFFNMTLDNPPDDPLDNPDDLISMAKEVLPYSLYIPTPPIKIDAQNIKHLLGLNHRLLCSSFIQSSHKKNVGNEVLSKRYIKSTTELKEAGIQFKSVDIEGKSSFHISFTNGVMEVPTWGIYGETEVEIRNLIAYEQYLPLTDQKVVTDYFIFLDCLVNTPKDVEILRQHGIFENGLGDDKELSSMINKLCNNVYRSENFSYTDVFNRVNKHCGRKRNLLMANLKHTYFNTPWAFISFLAAFILLLFTVTQTLFTIFPFVGYKP